MLGLTYNPTNIPGSSGQPTIQQILQEARVNLQSNKYSSMLGLTYNQTYTPVFPTSEIEHVNWTNVRNNEPGNEDK